MATVAVTLSLTTSWALLWENQVLSGPGDQLEYYRQAARLIPFTNHYYGPGYFIAIRTVRDVFGVEWFEAGKLVSWMSAWFVLLWTWLLASRLAGRLRGLFALTLVAINPVFISQSYSSLTIMFGAACILGVIAALLFESDRSIYWLSCGIGFGLAYLVRFQSGAFLLGALGGVLIRPGLGLRKRLSRVLLLALGATLPPLIWWGFLVHIQGEAPQNWNYLNMAKPLGEYDSFLQADATLAKYGSMWGLLTSHWTAPLRILAFAAKEAVKFPFDVAFSLLFLGAGWLIPGLIVAVSERRLHGPWLCAFLVGLFLTGIGSWGWPHYYVPFLPFTAILIAIAINNMGVVSGNLFGPRCIAWAVVLGGTLCWSPFQVRNSFLENNWSELKAAQAFLRDRLDPDSLVTSTAGTVAYGTGRRFVDQSGIMRPEECNQLASALRRSGVTHLVVTERHTLNEFPGLEHLLSAVSDTPAGLRREMLIESPKRLAIYRVLYE
jgi:4-amino-4-deoxy-L-arabinose transferase-like glycosyltransferase